MFEIYMTICKIPNIIWTLTSEKMSSKALVVGPPELQVFQVPPGTPKGSLRLSVHPKGHLFERL